MILPAGDTVIHDGPFTTGASAFKEFWYMMAAFASEAQSIDGNGSLVNTATGGGDTLIKTGKLSGRPKNRDILYGTRSHAAARHPAEAPVQEADVQDQQGLLQERQAEPERPRGDARTARPGAALEEGQVRHAIRKNMREFIAVIVMVLIALVVGGYILSHQRFYLPGVGAGPGHGLLRAEGRVQHRAGGHARPGPDGRDRGRAGGGDQARRARWTAARS